MGHQDFMQVSIFASPHILWSTCRVDFLLGRKYFCSAQDSNLVGSISVEQKLFLPHRNSNNEKSMSLLFARQSCPFLRMCRQSLSVPPTLWMNLEKSKNHEQSQC